MDDPGHHDTAPFQEDVLYEGGPHRMDLFFGFLAGLTVVGLPLAVASVVRALWLRFRIGSRTITVRGGFLGRSTSTVSYSQIEEVKSVSRGFGLYGDMVLHVKSDGTSGMRVEMRAVPDFRRWKHYIEERRDALVPRKQPKRTSQATGFAS